MIPTILIDDELDSLSALRLRIKEFCPRLHVVVACNSAQEGIQAIKKYEPELIFLDIEMPHMNGFELLEKVKDQKLSVIFTTAYHH